MPANVGEMPASLDIPNYFESSFFRTAMNASYRKAVFWCIYLYFYIADNPLIYKGLSLVFLFNFIHGYFEFIELYFGDMMGNLKRLTIQKC